VKVGHEVDRKQDDDEKKVQEDELVGNEMGDDGNTHQDHQSKHLLSIFDQIIS
jgi:hypothetical protein